MSEEKLSIRKLCVLLAFLIPVTGYGLSLSSINPVPDNTRSGVQEDGSGPEFNASDPGQRMVDGDGEVTISGELKQWHKVTLNLDGPFARDLDGNPNPFMDYNMTVTFTHHSGEPEYEVPGYFAADGNAGNSGADHGTIWKAHLSPDKNGEWTYEVSFLKGERAAVNKEARTEPLSPYHGLTGSFSVTETDKSGRDFRAKGRLEYVGRHHLQFQGSGEYFLKAGPDAPETFLAYEGFDGTYAMKSNVPLKKYEPHLKDWNPGDPTWKGGQGKGIIGALNYLSSKGLNAFSFLTYNAMGDGDNIWPFVSRNEKYHYDCSKLDQWQIVFDHAQKKGLYLHFKTQETENDDLVRGRNKDAFIPAALDGGKMGVERSLYYRELIARFGYSLALNWNLGEENTQSTEVQRQMAQYLWDHCPYPHNIVIHTYPGQQDKVYTPLLGDSSMLTGASLQNHWDKVFERTLQWVKASDEAGKPWVVANDEQGGAGTGVPPDPGYNGWDAGELDYDIHNIRKESLWANLMAGGAGVEYYFGYKLPQNDLVCEDYRSRDKSWDYCAIALNFFKDHRIPFQDMSNRNDLIGNADGNKEKFCLAKEGEYYVVYLAYATTSELDLSEARGRFEVSWFNPRTGGELVQTGTTRVKGGKVVELGDPPADPDQDWVVLVQKK